MQDKSASYFRTKFSTLPESLFPPRREAATQGEPAVAESDLPRDLYSQLRRFGADHHATTEQVWLSLLYCYFTRAAERGDLCIFVRSGTQRAGTEPATDVGSATLVPSWFRLGTERAFLELLTVMAEEVVRDGQHGRHLSDEPWQERGLSFDTPLCELTFSYRSCDRHAHDDRRKLMMDSLPSWATQRGLSIQVEEYSGGLLWTVTGHGNLFSCADLVQLQQRIEGLLGEVLQKPQAAIWQLPLVSNAERELLLGTWNRTESPYPDDRCIHTLFEEQVQRTPMQTALVWGGQRMSYAELDAKTNQVARALRRHGVRSERLVGLLMDRGVSAIVGLLGILKAGGAYVPLDSSAPQERLRWILEDTQITLLLTTNQLGESLHPWEHRSGTSLSLEDDKWYRHEPETPIPPEECSSGPRSLAYVIYTSGSTGRPKGVLIEHRSICNHCAAWQGLLKHQVGRRILHSSPLFFDAAVWEIYPALASGAELHIPTEEEQLPGPALLALLRQQRIQVLGTTPSSLAALPPGELPDLEVVLAGGEACSAGVVARFAPGRQMWNAYGPTEATCDASAALCVVDGVTPPIGRPLPNTKLYVLDKRRQLLPIGVPGELYIGGVGLARGYLGQPELTEQKFIPDPFSAQLGGRLYATGDRACWRADGQLEFLGRSDHQVKLRGVRIELGEIESVLGSHPDVQACVVVVREGKGRPASLVGYVVVRPGGAENPLSLREYLGRVLPSYMVPAAFVFLAAIPLTPNGKLATDALPEIDPAAAMLGTPFVSPRTPVERTLTLLFGEVLALDKVGIHDNFFALGGDSIAALQIVARSARIGLRFGVKQLFQNPTVAELATCAKEGPIVPATASQLSPDRAVSAAAADNVQTGEYTPADFPLCGLTADELRELLKRLQVVGRGVLEDVYPLSPMQEGMLFHTVLSPGSPVYYEQTIHSIVGTLDKPCLRAAWQQVVDRQPALRTAFVLEQGSRPLQCVYSQVAVPFVVHDWTSLPTEHVRHSLEELCRQRRSEGFTLHQPPLLRIDLIETGPERWELILGFHHALIDGWSEPKLLAEVVATYDARMTAAADHKQRTAVPSLRDYVTWLSQRDLLQAESYFRRALAGFHLATVLPGSRPAESRVPQQDKRPAQVTRTLAPALWQALRNTAGQNRLTTGSLFQGAFALLLARLSGEDDIVFGATVAGRPPELPDIETRLGPFINTIPVRAKIDVECSFAQWTQRLQEQQVESRVHETVPLVQVQGWSEVPRGQTLFDCVFVFENYPREPDALRSRSGWHVQDVHQHEMTNFALTVAVIPGQELTLKFEYDANHFEPGAIERLEEHYETLLAAVVADPHASIWRLPLLSDSAWRTIGVDWNNTKTAYPDTLCIQELFEVQVQRSPDALALRCEQPGQRLSYRELSERAAQWAHELRRLGVGPNVPVGLLVTSVFDRLVAMLAIFKAGGVYVPLDPEHPDERIRFLLQDLTTASAHGALLPSVLLFSQDCVDRVPSSESRQVCLDDVQAAADKSHTECLILTTQPDDLSYVLYTSGSTGKPKGVAVTHRNVVHSTCARMAVYEEPVRRCLQLASCMFDSSIAEILWTLCSGGTLVVPAQPIHKNPQILRALIAKEKISHLLCVPSLYALILEQPGDRADLSSLTTVILGGESFPRALVDAHREQVPQASLHNEYGPTEATVWSTTYRIAADLPQAGVIPIGRPIPNSEVYILDKRLQPLPVGVAGELCIGGAGVAPGYLDRPALTAEKFVSVRLCHRSDLDRRLYKSGDKARFLPDGSIEFLGRLDHQVKLRGYRVELGEIEALLSTHPQVKGCAVLLRQDSPADQRLVAYIVGHAEVETPPTSVALRELLKSHVPSYMIPSSFVFLSSLPLTASGKVDRRALPPPAAAEGSSATYVAPRTPTEQILSEVFAQVLRIDRVSIHDDFFALGGHSLLCLQVVSRAARSGLSLAVRDVYTRPSVAELAGQIGTQPLASCVLPLVAGRAPGSIVFLPAVGGHLSGHILRLIRELKGERRILGLTTPPHAGTGTMPQTLPALCTLYAEQLSALYAEQHSAQNRQEPISLVGYCFGGLAALELACQLQAIGHHVDRVILLETVAPHLEEPSSDLGRFDRTAAFLRVAERWELQLDPSKIAGATEQEVIAQIMAALAVPRSDLTSGYAVDTLRAIVDTQESSRDMAATWHPRIPNAPVHLIRVTEHEAVDMPLDYGWSAIGTLASVESVPGDHFGFIRSPHVELTAQFLRRLLS